MKKFLIGVVIGVLLITAGILFVQRDFISAYLSEKEEQKIKTCVTDTDCILVQRRGWCNSISAINRNFEDRWYEKSAKLVEQAERERWTCEPTTAVLQDLNNYEALCDENQTCKARFK